MQRRTDKIFNKFRFYHLFVEVGQVRYIDYRNLLASKEPSNSAITFILFFPTSICLWSGNEKKSLGVRSEEHSRCVSSSQQFCNNFHSIVPLRISLSTPTLHRIFAYPNVHEQYFQQIVVTLRVSAILIKLSLGFI